MSANSTTAPKRSIASSVLGLLGLSGLAGVLVAALVTPFIAVAGVAANSSITLFESLPSYLDIKPLQQMTEMYGMSGGQEVKFAEVYSQNRVEVPLDQISDYVKQAAISTEDPRFYEHGGVDVISATRAMVGSVLGQDDAGASTITMQYVRNVRVQAAESLPTKAERDKAYEEANEHSVARKLQEMRLAIGVEKQFTKDQILNGYLNIALFGGQIYGIEAAAQYYYGKSAKDLSLPESASLVATVQNPDYYRIDNPDNIQNNTDRRNYVLKNMLDEKYISQDDYDQAVATPVEPVITPTQDGCMNAGYNAQFFCDYVKNVILNEPQFGSTYEERLTNFQTKGYQIHTTIDLDLQQTAVDAINSNVPMSVDYMELGTTAVSVEPGTGHILTMAQNKIFDETSAADTDPTHTSINYNTDFNYGGSSGFQVGSTYKIFTLANWLESGHSLTESIDARNRSFNMANFANSCDGESGGTWAPNNDSGERFGTVTAVQAAQQSINTAFVAMGEKLDQCRTRDIAMGMGAHRADGQVNGSQPSAILGTNEIAPLSMATAIAGFANGGKSCTPIAISSITMRDGSEVQAPASTCTQVIPEAVAWAADYALKAVMTGGTGQGTQSGIPTQMIGKSGTSDNAYDTWVIASSTKIATAVWVGNVTGKVSEYNHSVAGGSLTQVRHKIANPIMKAGTAKYGGDDFPQPDESAFQVKYVTVPNTVGMALDEATSTLEAAGFTVDTGSPINSDQPEGRVAMSNPTGGTSTPQGSTVTLSPSNGKQDAANGKVVMPDLTGKTVNDAVAALSAAGFKNTGGNWLQYTGTGGGAAGTIVKTNPPAGTTLDPNSTISLYVA